MLQNAMRKPPSKDELRAAAEAAMKSGVEVKRLRAAENPDESPYWKRHFKGSGMTLGQLNNRGSAHGHHHSNKKTVSTSDHDITIETFYAQGGVCPRCRISMWLAVEGREIAAKRLNLPTSGHGWIKALQARRGIYKKSRIVICCACDSIQQTPGA